LKPASHIVNNPYGLPSNWKQQLTKKCRYILKTLHVVTSKQALIVIVLAIRISDLKNQTSYRQEVKILQWIKRLRKLAGLLQTRNEPYTAQMTRNILRNSGGYCNA